MVGISAHLAGTALSVTVRGGGQILLVRTLLGDPVTQARLPRASGAVHLDLAVPPGLNALRLDVVGSRDRPLAFAIAVSATPAVGGAVFPHSSYPPIRTGWS